MACHLIYPPKLLFLLFTKYFFHDYRYLHHKANKFTHIATPKAKRIAKT